MAWHRDDQNGGITHGDLHPVGAHHVVLRFASRVVGRFVDGLPVFRAVDQVYARDLVLQQLGAAIMVGMGVRKNDIFDLILIQAELLQAI